MARRRAIALSPTDRFTSDTHFSHASMLTQAARPWDEVADMDRAMIEHWNSVVDDRTVVWHLGDFSFWKLDRQRYEWIFGQLRGIKRLVVGNHDPDPVLALKWDQVHHGVVIGHDKVADVKVAMSHYPMREWPEFYRGAVHLHGHTHDTLPSSNRSWDCGVDHQGFTPLTLAEIRARMGLLPNLDFTGVPAADWTDDRAPQDEAEQAEGYGQ